MSANGHTNGTAGLSTNPVRNLSECSNGLEKEASKAALRRERRKNKKRTTFEEEPNATSGSVEKAAGASAKPSAKRTSTLTGGSITQSGDLTAFVQSLHRQSELFGESQNEVISEGVAGLARRHTTLSDNNIAGRGHLDDDDFAKDEQLITEVPGWCRTEVNDNYGSVVTKARSPITFRKSQKTKMQRAKSIRYMLLKQKTEDTKSSGPDD